MTTTNEHRKWKNAHMRLLADHRKWKADNKRAVNALKKLETLVKEHNNTMKAFEKKAKANRNLMNGSSHSPSLHKKLKKVYLKQNRGHAMHGKSRNNILKITRAIENTIKHS